MRGPLRILLPFVLVFSLALNGFMYFKWNRKRPVLSVNGQSIRQKEVDDYLEQDKGPAVKAALVQRLMLDQEAKKQGVVPSEAEMTEEFNQRKERDAGFAQQMAINPWKEMETRNQIREQLEQVRLRAKTVSFTDQEIQDEYNTRPQVYDAPDKARCEMALVRDESRFDAIQNLMKKDPPVSPTAIQKEMPGAVLFWGDAGVYTFTQPFGTQNNVIFTMKPGEVREIPVQQDMARYGIKRILVKLLKIEPGHKNSATDAKTREKIQMGLVESHTKPFEEYLGELWSKADFQSEDPQDRGYVERILFPTRGATMAASAK